MERIRLICAALTFILLIMQIVAAYKMMSFNGGEGLKKLNGTDYFDMTIGEEVCGTAENIVYELDDEEENLAYYLMRVDDKLVILRTSINTATDKSIKSVMYGNTKSFEYRGIVHKITDNEMAGLKLNLIVGNQMKKWGMTGKIADHLVMTEKIDITSYNTTISPELIGFTIAGIPIVLVLTILFARKPVKNLIYAYSVKSGRIKRNNAFTKDDAIFEKEGLYEKGDTGENFYVNTEYDVWTKNDYGIPDEHLHGFKFKVFGQECEYVSPTSDTPETKSDEEGFYTGGLNLDGNFYVETDMDKKDDDDSDKYLPY